MNQGSIFLSDNDIYSPFSLPSENGIFPPLTTRFLDSYSRRGKYNQIFQKSAGTKI
jgi:hypothetical protein